MGLFYDQMTSLYQGYKDSVANTAMDEVTLEDIVTMNIFGDLEDLEQVFQAGNKVRCRSTYDLHAEDVNQNINGGLVWEEELA